MLSGSQFSVCRGIAERIEKFRGGNVTKVGNHRLLLGGKQADNWKTSVLSGTGFVYYSQFAALRSVGIRLVLS